MSRIITLVYLSLQVNKGELLEKISDIRKEYAEVVKEAQAIQDTQRVMFNLQLHENVLVLLRSVVIFIYFFKHGRKITDEKLACFICRKQWSSLRENL